MEEMKKCPHCGEEIKAEAKKCRYCGEWLDEQPDAKVSDENAQPDVEQRPTNAFTVSYFYNYFIGGIKKCVNFKDRATAKELWMLIFYCFLFFCATSGVEMFQIDETYIYREVAQYVDNDFLTNIGVPFKVENNVFQVLFDTVLSIFLILVIVAGISRRTKGRKLGDADLMQKQRNISFNGIDIAAVAIAVVLLYVGSGMAFKVGSSCVLDVYKDLEEWAIMYQ